MRREQKFPYWLADAVAWRRGGTREEQLAHWLRATVFLQRLISEQEERRRALLSPARGAWRAMSEAEREQLVAEWLIQHEDEGD